MASTYTSNTGIEKIGSGEQAGTWGNTTNNNLDIIDRALNGSVTLTITGNTTLTTSDGTLSNGQFKIIILSGSPSGAFNLTIDPNDQQKWYFIKNDSGQTATVKQGGGSGSTVAVATGLTAILFADGTGANANVTSNLLAAVVCVKSALISADVIPINDPVDVCVKSPLKSAIPANIPTPTDVLDATPFSSALAASKLPPTSAMAASAMAA